MGKSAKEFEKKLRSLNSAEATHAVLEKAYKMYKPLIDELVKWRNFLRIKINSKYDEAVAYLIHYIHQQHKSTWKHELEKIRHELLKHPNGLHENYLNSLSHDLFKRELKMDITSGKGKLKPAVLNMLVETCNRVSERSNRFLKLGKIEHVQGIPAEYLPIWFFIARPEHEFYQNEYIKKKITPLIKSEEAEDIKKLSLLNQMHEIYVAHTYHDIYNARFKAYLVELSAKVREELKLRKQTEGEPGIDKVSRLDKKIKTALEEQEALWGKFKSSKKNSFEISLKYALHKETKKELQKIFDRISKEIEKELKRFK